MTPTSLPAPGAVFLSYASQDAAAARRICDALRAAGLEVWLDQSALAGGDAWDNKIRGQIAACALFVPIISASTQERLEGYFRIEWKLAAQRTHAMAEAKPFLVPVVIDATRDAEAHVPAEFKAVQWTRLRPAGFAGQARDDADEALEKFCARVKALLTGSVMETGRPRPVARGEGAASPTNPPVRRRVPAAAWLAAAIVLIATAAFFALRPASQENAGAGQRPPATEKSAAAPAAPRLGPKSIAVLPFDNLSEDRDDNAFFAEGMHDEVINHLHLIRELKCIPRASATTYRGTKKSPREIADELGVAFLLNATVRRAGGKIRLTATLLNPRSDETVWHQPYEKNLTETFALQSELAQAIATQLRAFISPDARKLLERPPTTDLAAYDSFLKARDLRHRGPTLGREWHPRRVQQTAESLLQAAVAIDPNFALAWADLTRLHCIAYLGQYNSWRDRSPARREKARTAIAMATKLAPDEPEVLLARGYYYQCWERDFGRAAAEFQKAAGLLPSSPDPITALAQLQRSQGRWIEALANFRQATLLDPLDAAANAELLALLTAGRRFDELAAEYRRLATSSPSYAFSQARLSFNATGSSTEIEEYLAKSPAQMTVGGVSIRGHQWRFSHQHEKFQLPLAQLNQLPLLNVSTTESWDTALHLAVFNAAQGNLDETRRRVAAGPANLRARLELDPENVTLLGDLGCIEALLGHRDEALRALRAAMELTPTQLDRWVGPQIEETLAFVHAWTGDKDNAIATYARLLQSPCVSPRLAGMNVHTMRHSLWFFPLRGDPRWEKLLDDPKNQAPLF